MSMFEKEGKSHLSYPWKQEQRDEEVPMAIDWMMIYVLEV